MAPIRCPGLVREHERDVEAPINLLGTLPRSAWYSSSDNTTRVGVLLRGHPEALQRVPVQKQAAAARPSTSPPS